MAEASGEVVTASKLKDHLSATLYKINSKILDVKGLSKLYGLTDKTDPDKMKKI